MPLTRFIVELHKEGIYVYLTNGIFSFKKLDSGSKIITFKIDELYDYMRYISLHEFITLIINRLA